MGRDVTLYHGHPADGQRRNVIYWHPADEQSRASLTSTATPFPPTPLPHTARAGFFNNTVAGSFGIASFDWSNNKKTWAATSPMNDLELMLQQAAQTKAASPSTRVFICACVCARPGGRGSRPGACSVVQVCTPGWAGEQAGESRAPALLTPTLPPPPPAIFPQSRCESRQSPALAVSRAGEAGGPRLQRVVPPVQAGGVAAQRQLLRAGMRHHVRPAAVLNPVPRPVAEPRCAVPGQPQPRRRVRGALRLRQRAVRGVPVGPPQRVAAGVAGGYDVARARRHRRRGGTCVWLLH
jgi:hypothetical protein